MRTRKSFAAAVSVLFIVPLLSVCVCGGEYEFSGDRSTSFYPGEEMSDLAEKLPEDVRQEIKDFISSENDADRTEAIKKKTEITYWAGKVAEILKDMLIPSVKGGASLLCIVLLSTVINAAMALGENERIRQMSSLVTSLMTAAVTMKLCLQAADAASGYIANISSAMTGMIPVMGAVMLTGGGVSTASVNSASLMLYLTVTENLCRLIVIPLCGALLALSAVSGVFTGVKIGGFVSALRRLLMTVISFSMLVFSFVLGIQTSLARSADSLAAKTVRFAVGSYIPVVGGAVSEALSTLSASLSVIRSMAGAVGIVIILLILLPTLVTLLLTRLNLILCKSACELLGFSDGERMIGEADGIMAVFCAMSILSAVFFIFAVVLFMGSGVR